MMRLFGRRASSALSEARSAYPDKSDLDALHLLSAACRKSGRHEAAREALAEALRCEFALRAADETQTAQALAELLWTQPAARWRHRLADIERLGWAFSRFGGYAVWGEPLLRDLASRDPTQLPRTADEPATSAILRLLDFHKNAPSAWLEAVFTRLVWPWMRRALDAGRYGLALMLETHAYGAYVLHKESGHHFREAMGVWTDAMREAGRNAAEVLPALPPSGPASLPAVAFYLHSRSVLGHTQILVEFLEAHAKLERPMIRPHVFVRAAAVAELRERLAAIAVPCHELEKDPSDGGERDFHALLRLREQIAAQQIGAVVWVSVALHMAFAFSLRVAPVQIWWAMKYHSLEFPEIDGYLTNQSAGSTKQVEGKLWRSAPLASQDWYRPQLELKAAEIRALYGQHALLFGCIGREEKINSAPFLRTVARILQACPQAGFLWSGRERSSAIQSALESLGVAARCHYIGWVDTKLYAQVLDIFLDSFPFPCGFTLYEAMAAAKPVVVFASAEAAETGIYGLLAPLLSGIVGTEAEVQAAKRLFRGGELFYCAHDEQAYAAHALMLANDEHARHEAAAVNRAFVQEFLSDGARMARAVGTHLSELMQAKPRHIR
jgi:hypothetical protein